MEFFGLIIAGFLIGLGCESAGKEIAKAIREKS